MQERDGRVVSGTATKESKVGLMEEGGQLHVVVSYAKMLILPDNSTLENARVDSHNKG